MSNGRRNIDFDDMSTNEMLLELAHWREKDGEFAEACVKDIVGRALLFRWKADDVGDIAGKSVFEMTPEELRAHVAKRTIGSRKPGNAEMKAIMTALPKWRQIKKS
jgi:hypothetical protein